MYEKHGLMVRISNPQVIDFMNKEENRDIAKTKLIEVAQSEGSESPHQEDDNGEVKTFMLFKMRVSVLTSGTQDRM